jgi:hypothetical protein
MKVQKIITARDYDKAERNTPRARKEAAAVQAAEVRARTLKENPHIGVLVRKGKEVFYSYASGEYREGALAEVL